MNIQTRLRLTKTLVVVSIIGSIFSVYTSEKGLGEIYPFFFWKLYSQPLGTQRTCTEYRIYSRDKDGSAFKRNPIHATKTFTLDEYLYSFNYLVTHSLEDSLNAGDYRKKLLIFSRHVVPGKKDYKIVSETYRPADLLIPNYTYDTATVIRF
jgi:hypothetical protein